MNRQRRAWTARAQAWLDRNVNPRPALVVWRAADTVTHVTITDGNPTGAAWAAYEVDVATAARWVADPPKGCASILIDGEQVYPPKPMRDGEVEENPDYFGLRWDAYAHEWTER